MENESIGRISLDLQIQSDIESQVKQVSKNIGESLKQSVNGVFKGTFGNMSKQTKSNMDGVSKNIKSAMSSSVKTVQTTMTAINDKIKNTISHTASAAKKAGGMKTSGSSGDALTSTYNRQTEAVKRQQIAVDQLRIKYENMLSGDVKPSSLKKIESELKKVQAEIKMTEQEYNKAFEKMQNAQFSASLDKAAKGRISSAVDAEIQQVEAELDRLGAKLGTADSKAETLKSTLNQIRMNPSASDEAATLQSKLELATEKLNRLKNEAQGTASKMKNMSSWTSRFSAMLNGAKSKISSFGAGIKKVGGFFSSLIGKLKQVLTHSKHTKNAFNGLGKSSNSLGKNLLRLGNMFKLMLTRMILRGVISGAKEGFQNLAQYSDSTNKAISSLMSALAQLKNSFATAFAPILNVVAPILTKFINLLSQGFNAIGMFFAALTGQSSYTKAVGVTKDYAASLSGAANNAKSASKEAKNYQKTIAGFDEINKLNEQNDSSDSSNQGGSSGGVSNMFETVSIDSGIASLAQRIKDAITSGNFAEIGQMLGNAINEGVKKFSEFIDWNNIGGKITHFVKAFATIFNNTVSTIDWFFFGQAVGKGVNTVVNTVNLLSTSINWVNLGKSFANGLNGLLKEVNWGTLGQSISNGFMLLWDILYGSVTNFDWDTLGKSIGDLLNGSVQNLDLSKIGTTIGTAITGVFHSLGNFVKTFDWKALGVQIYEGINSLIHSIDWSGSANAISNFVRGFYSMIQNAMSNIDWVGLFRGIVEFILGIDWLGLLYDFINVSNLVVEILLKGILGALIGIGSWIKEKVVDPIIDWFKKLFGINSPSTVFAEMGGYLIQGLINGISSLIDKVIDVFKNLWEGIKNVFASVGNWFKDKFSIAWEGVKNIFSSIGSWFGDRWNDVKNVFSTVGTWFSDKFKSAVSGIKNAFSSIGSFFSGVWNNITGVFSNVSGWFKDKFSRAWEAVKNVFSTGGKIFDGIKDGILNGLKSVINSIIGGINRVVEIPFNGLNSALNKLRNLSILGARPFSWIGSISVPKIPQLATGGIIDSPTLAMVGETNHKEAVLPLEENTGWMDLIADKVVNKLGGNGGGISKADLEEIMNEVAHKIVSALNALGFYVDSELLAKAIQKGAAKRNRRFNVV